MIHNRPSPTPGYIDNLLIAGGIQPAHPVILGRRGYFDAMGQQGVNDLGIYDDAIFVCPPDGSAVGFNANTDPSRQRPGIATLQPGRYLYKIGTHGITRPAEARYTALVQAGPVTIRRSGAGTEAGWFGINIHRGGENTTSSEGCQTIYRPQWDEFIGLVERLMDTHRTKTIEYILSEWKGKHE